MGGRSTNDYIGLHGGKGDAKGSKKYDTQKKRKIFREEFSEIICRKIIIFKYLTKVYFAIGTEACVADSCLVFKSVTSFIRHSPLPPSMEVFSTLKAIVLYYILNTDDFTKIRLSTLRFMKLKI